MASRAQLVTDGVQALAVAAYPGATVKRGGDDGDKPARIPDGGLVIVRRGDAGEPDVLLSPLSYTYAHPVQLDVGVYPTATQTAEQKLDEVLQALDAAIAADRTLGGLCEFVEAQAPEFQSADADGVEPFMWATVPIVCTYTVASPLA